MTRLSNRRRWLLFALVLTAGVLNYVDRQIIAVLKPMISADLGWSDDDYGTLAAWFQGAAAAALLFTGWLVDRLGVKWANPVGVVAWSIAALAHGWATSFVQFIVVRVSLGATEAMGTPSSVKTVSVILPPHLRSLGFGLSNAVSSAGAVLAPLAIPAFALVWGWRGAFVAAGLVGIVWGLLWLVASRGIDFGDRGQPEPAPIAPDADAPITEYGPILKERRTWAIAIAKVLSDATWWLMLFWLPDFFNRQFGLSGVDLGPPLAIAYTGSAIGSLIGGGVQTRLLGLGWSVNRVRKTVMFCSAVLVLPVPLVLFVDSPWEAAAVLGLVLAAHQGFSTSLFSLIADVAPAAKIGRITAFGAFSGHVGGTIIVKVAGLVLAAGLGYLPLLLFASVSYLLALGWIHLLLPVIRPIGQPGAAVGLVH